MMKTSHRRPELPHWRVPRGQCRWCGKETGTNRRNWHPECVDVYKLACHSETQRAFCLERDKGICAVCGIDTLAERQKCLGTIPLWRWLARRHFEAQIPPQTGQGSLIYRATEDGIEKYRKEYGWPKNWSQRGSWWQADHRTALCNAAQDSAAFTGQNLQTLCWRCHRAKTTRDVRQLRGKPDETPVPL